MIIPYLLNISPFNFILAPIAIFCCALVLLVSIIIFIVIIKEVRSTSKKCPYCTSKIPKDAVWCKHCKRDLSEFR